MDFLIYLAIALITFVGMEFVARLMHKYLMHGLLWSIHKDHHYPTSSSFQKNDLFGLLFAGISVYLMLLWITSGNLIPLSVALGMTGYGIAYFTIHDMVIHNRHLRLRKKAMSNPVLRTLIEVHDVHHREGKGNWGFLLVIPGIDKIPRKESTTH
ncbi:sterol desaturase family protein [Stygiolobus caldivivus]|uniref:Beta-carotene hydroxylase n=1 Tax=Stygiolobus caldivivus TaxID=2824673 RepID=A0A8D5ZIS0_9CREN|nr:sterol desaturase family protein [Stygiolobus caldivivus]BCU69645.1 beta-carotene hydroxylase [Stygiolobus caldivivus]